MRNDVFYGSFCSKVEKPISQERYCFLTGFIDFFLRNMINLLRKQSVYT